MLHKRTFVIFIIAVLGLLLLLALDYFGIIWHNEPFALRYEIKGLDVSHHQKEIDWPTVAAQNKYSFVFIKATEGHDFTDDDFLRNWKDAKENGITVGAYHFFSARSSGTEQAEFFIATVPKEDGTLPPVIDIEISLSRDKETIRKEIKDMSMHLENYYHKKPILYITYDIYNAYIKEGDFSENKIWIRDIVKPPTLQGRDWTFWQYSNRGRIDGITEYTDLNVFKGTREELENLTR
jgi:lysozyme